MAEKRPIGRGPAGAAGLLLVLGLSAYFFHTHPPRPLFSAPVPGEGPFPAGSHATALLGGLFYGALLLAAGTGLRRLLRAGRSGAGALPLGAAYGSILAFLLIAVGAFRPPVFTSLLLLPALFSGRPRMPRLPGRLPRIGFVGMAGGALLLLAGIHLLLRALAPLTANDALVYHMPLARAYAGGGGFGGAPDLVYGKMPHGGDLLYAGAFLFGGEGAARIFHVWLAGAGALLAASLARALRPGGTGLPAAVLFLTLPLLLDPRTVGNVDLGAVLFFGGSLLGIARRGGGRGELVAAALLAGALLTVKYSVLPAYGILAAALLLPLFGAPPSRSRGRDLALFAPLSFALFLPWAMKGWAETGNPLFPLLPDLLGGRGWDPVLAGRLVAWQRSIGMGREFVDWLLLPWNVVFHGQPRYDGFDGVLSPALLLWGPWAACRGGKIARRALLLLLAGLYLWGLGPQQLRFFLPGILLAAAVGGAWWRTERGWIGAAQGALFFIIPLLLLAPALRETARDTWPVVSGREGREEYLARKIQSYEAFRRMERSVPEGEKVALLWENRIYYGTRPWIADSFFEASGMVRRAEIAGSPDRFLAALRSEGASWILVNRPLGGIFSRFSPSPSIGWIEEALRGSARVGGWKGLELFRIPAEEGPRPAAP